jgi:Protein of unknown function (DUF3574)
MIRRVPGTLAVFRMICLITLVASQTGCAAMPGAVCPVGSGRPMQVFDLFFGRAVAGRDDLTEKEWQAFVDHTVTVSLPDGYTVMDASGAWMNPITHQTTKEASRVIVVALPDGPDSLAAVNRIRTAYQVRFHQQLVGMTVTRACGSF